jgi:hypothetical protein
MKELEKLKKELNKWGAEAGFNFLSLKGIQERQKRENSDTEDKKADTENEREEPKPETEPEKPANKAKIVEKKKFDIRYENLGGDADFWVSIIEKGVFVLIINKNHLFFTKIYSSMDFENKGNISKLIFTMAWTQYTMKMENELEATEPIDNVTYMENYWTNVSVKLKHIILV